jgi:DNA-binding beta-propeller fold protein YncE
VLSTVVIPKSWYGIKFSSDEKFLYASGGNDNWILKYAIQKNQLVLSDSIKLGAKWPNKISPSGIEIDDAKKKMYVGTKENNTLYIIDLSSKKAIDSIKLDGEAYGCVLSPDKKGLYVSVWGADEVIVVIQQTEKFQII